VGLLDPFANGEPLGAVREQSILRKTRCVGCSLAAKGHPPRNEVSFMNEILDNHSPRVSISIGESTLSPTPLCPSPDTEVSG
jgi:hypothetical protein